MHRAAVGRLATATIKFENVIPDWNDRPAIVVGCGPSMKGFDFDRLRGLGRVLAVKNSIWDLPFADAAFGMDIPWMHREAVALERFARELELWLAIPEHGTEGAPAVIRTAWIVGRKREGERFIEDPGRLESCGNSGFCALNWVYHKRPPLIVLFGFDYHGEHYCPERYAHHNGTVGIGRYLTKWAANFNNAARQLHDRGIGVLNASPQSTVTAFRKCSIDEAISTLRGLQ